MGINNIDLLLPYSKVEETEDSDPLDEDFDQDV